MIKHQLVLCLVVFLALSACTKKEGSSTGSEASGNTILVGEYGSMTGGEATFGLSTDQGVKLAQKEINAAGGVKGKQIELKTFDDEGKSENAAIGVTKLITQDHVTAILGEVASSRSLAAAPIAQPGRPRPALSVTSVNVPLRLL